MKMAMFYIKIIGSACTVVTGALLGFSYGQDVERRYKELSELYRIFQMIHGEISYGMYTLREIICHVSEQSSKSFAGLFGYLEREMYQQSKQKFSDIWNQGVDQYLVESQLNSKDIQELKQIGENIGNIDKEQQLIMLKIYLSKLENHLLYLESEKDKKIKLYRMLGVLGAVFVVVILL